MKILVTSFVPFGEDAINASHEAVMALPAVIAGAEVVKATLPVEFGRSAASLRAAIATHEPDVVVCVGQAGGRYGITPERVAINVRDARIPDNAGHQPADEPVVASGPAAYFSTLPIKAMVGAMRAAGVPASVSSSAGTFVCNEVMYSLMHFIHTERPALRGGFVHVPYTPAQAAEKGSVPCLAVGDVARALEAAIGEIVGGA